MNTILTLTAQVKQKEFIYLVVMNIVLLMKLIVVGLNLGDLTFGNVVS